MDFNQYIWELYKKSGKSVISEFENSASDMTGYDLLLKYNPESAKFIDRDLYDDYNDIFWLSLFEGKASPESLDDARLFFEHIVNDGIENEEEVIIEPDDYVTKLLCLENLSYLLSCFAPDYFFPYLFRYHFFDLNKIVDAYDISIPPIPKKSNYMSRCMYYWSICESLYKFRKDNNLSPYELCAFLYDFAPKNLKRENINIPAPSQGWFIGGKKSSLEHNMNFTFWQANKDTKRGDILIFYETSPVSAITSIWIAQTDGVIDPFFHYYSNTYIGNKIDIPHITLKELQTDEYFSKHSLIRKKFQGVNGWTMNSVDYSELIRMIKAKGFKNQLPKLYAPKVPRDVNINLEHDVERKLLTPLLNSMGWHENVDFIRQLGIHAGRGHRIFPDYALHYNNKPDEECARVLIEAKLYMKNNQEIESAFLQARSYANLLNSSVIVLCDKYSLIVYEKVESFDRNLYKKYYWQDMENPDIFNELKNKLT